MSGIIYSSDGRTLLSVPDYTVSITIPPEVEYVYGENELKNAFYLCSDKLETVTFPADSQLISIQPYSFYQCSKLFSVDFSSCSHLESIEDYAFRYCSSLKNIIFPNESLSSFGIGCFQNSGLTSVHIPRTVVLFQSQTFMGCSSLRNVTYEKDINIASLGTRTFQSSGLQSLIIPKSVTSFHANCFEGCVSFANIVVESGNTFCKCISGCLVLITGTTLLFCPALIGESFTIPEGITILNSVSFSHSRIRFITLPSTLQKISSWCFIVAKIESIYIPDSVTVIDSNAFYQCTSLTSVRLSNNLISLPVRAFYGCRFSSIEIPEGITNIEDECFASNPNLISIILPSSLNTLGGGVFPQNDALDITFTEGSNLIIDYQYLIMDKMKTSVMQYIGSTSRANITIYNTTKTIKSNAFYNRKTVESIIFEFSSIFEVIEGSAFSGCSSLKSIEFPASIKTIGNYAFLSCTSLLSINLTSNIFCNLGTTVFSKCSNIKSVFLNGSSVENLGQELFLDCISLNFLILPYNLQSIDIYCFSGCTSLKSLNIPETTNHLGAYSFYFSGIENITFSESNSLPEIVDFTFYCANHLSYINIPSSVTTLGDRSFFETKIISFTVPDNVHTINNYCFLSCTFLSEFHIPSSCHLSHIGISVFEGCSSLSVIRSNISRYVVESGALFNSDRSELIVFPPASIIKFFNFPSSIRIISPYSFFGCYNLLTVSIPDNSVRTIGYCAFSNCIHLRMINIPISVISIESEAFQNCYSLKCGVIVESKDPFFLQDLITLSCLNRNALLPCIELQTICSFTSPIRSLFLIMSSFISYPL